MAKRRTAPTTASTIVPWWSDRPPRTTNRTTLSREQIVDAAIRIIEEEGLEALTMRRLGAVLGAGTTSAYWHVRDKEELLDFVVDALVSQLPVPGPTDDWTAWFRQLMLSFRELLLAHPNSARLFGLRAAVGPKALAVIEKSFEVLREAGLDPMTAADAYSVLVNYTIGFTVLDTTPPPSPGDTQLTMEEFVPLFRSYLQSLPAEAFPNLAAVADSWIVVDASRRFAFGLDCILDGLRARVEHASR